MKRKLLQTSLCLVLLMSINFLCVPYQVFAKPLTNYAYAKVEENNVYLYREANTNNAIFVIPQSFYVLLLSNFNDEFYKAQYKDIVGFVLKKEVQPIKGTPVNPYLEDSNFRVFSSDGTSLFSSPYPSQKPETVEELDVLSYVEFYGTIIGEEQVENRGLIWYFGKTKSGNYGYLYSGLCDDFNLNELPKNTEIFTFQDNPFQDKDNSYVYSFINQSTTLKIVIIICISLPALILVWLLFKPFDIAKKTTLKKIKASNSKVIKEIQDSNEEVL